MVKTKIGLRIAWGITGAGAELQESIETMKEIKKDFGVDVILFLSKSAEMVIRWYKLWDQLKEDFPNFKKEKGPNTPFFAGELQVGKFGLLIISPCTGNCTAKIAYGIADTLVTNCVSMAMKGGTPVYIYPVDQKKGRVITKLPEGKNLTLKMREIDIENVERLKRMEGLTVLSHPKEIKGIIKRYLENKA